MNRRFSLVSFVSSLKVVYGFLFIVGTYLIYLIGESTWAYGSNFVCWDYMQVSGFASFIFAMGMASRLPKKLDETLQRLKVQNTLLLRDDEIAELKTQMEHDGRRIQFWSGLLILSVIFGSFVWALRYNFLEIWQIIQAGRFSEFAHGIIEFGVFTFLSLLAALWAGVFFGRLTVYGMLADTLSDSRQRLRIRPDHFDGAAGLKPIGDFYLYQALVFAVPILWLGIWWAWVLPNFAEATCTLTGYTKTYAEWEGPFFIQWLVVLSYFFFGFVKPIFKLSKRIRNTKKRLETESVPKIRNALEMLQQALGSGKPTEDTREQSSEADRLATLLWQIRKMPIWPMDVITLRRYVMLVVGEGILPIIIEKNALEFLKPVLSAFS